MTEGQGHCDSSMFWHVLFFNFDGEKFSNWSFSCSCFFCVAINLPTKACPQ